MDALDIIAREFNYDGDRDAVAKSLEAQGFTVHESRIDGELAFVALVRGPEFHFASAGSGKPLSIRAIKTFLKNIIDVHGFAQTKTPVGDFRQQRFNESIGFRRMSEDKDYITYRIRKVQCQSSQ